MTLTPEQKAEGWRLHDGSDVCPIKDNRTKFRFIQLSSGQSDTVDKAGRFYWQDIIAYRIIEAHGADAEPARPTPFPAGMDDLVYDADGISQPFMTGGKWPDWLPQDTAWTPYATGGIEYTSSQSFDNELAIRVRRREPKRETVPCFVVSQAKSPFSPIDATIDLIDGKPDLSTLKIAGDAL